MRKWKWKNHISLWHLHLLCLPPFGFPYRFFLKIASLPMYSSKNLYNNIWLFLCVLVGAFGFLFERFFTAVCHVWYGFLVNLRTSIFSSHQVRVTNTYGNLSNQINLKLKGQHNPHKHLSCLFSYAGTTHRELLVVQVSPNPFILSE